MKYITEKILHKPYRPTLLNKQPALNNQTNTNEVYLDLISAAKHPKAIIDKLMVEYGLAADMKLFGYTYEIREGGVYAKCDYYRNDRCC